MPHGTAPEKLTRGRIVAAVTDLLGHGGIDSVSTRTVGEALEVHPTALYRHFRDMDEVLREAADGILAGLADAPGPNGDGDPLTAVTALCRRLRTILFSHPGAAQVMASGPSLMPNEQALTERIIGLLRRTGLPDSEAVLAYHALMEYVIGSSAIDSPGSADTPEEVELRHRAWRGAYFSAPPERFPHTTRLAALLYPPLEDQFEFGINLLISGIRQRANCPAAQD
jgi:TetR/AcrR family tetracycline transcriptional repressor